MALINLPQQPILTASQFERISTIFDNIGQGIFVVVVITPLVEGFDKTNPLVITLGLICAIFCWVSSIYLARKKDDV